MGTKLEPFRVGLLHYRCRDIGYGEEEDTVEVYFSGEMDSWGKVTVVPVNPPPSHAVVESSGDVPLYLFLDEIVSWEPYGDEARISTLAERDGEEE